MAWNDQGGNRDPWQRGNRGNQGPPDLDEAFRKLQERLGKIFGGGGGGRGGGGRAGKGLSGSLALLILAGLAVAYLVLGVYTVDQQERAVVLRFGEAQEDIVQPGLHWNPPLVDRVLLVNVTRVRSLPHDSEMLTEDENIVKVVMTVQYIISDVRAYALNVRGPDEALRQAMESALRHVVGSTKMEDVLTKGRAELGAAVLERIQTYIDLYGTGIEVTEVNIADATVPGAVQAAFDDVIKAREDQERLGNEAQAYANQIVPEARGQAQRLLEEAQAYKERVIARSKGEAERFNKLYQEYRLAPEVTRARIYLDTLEQVMSNSTKVMIDVEEGNNILYLPLDKIIEQRQTGAGSPARQGGGQAAPDYNSGNSGRRARERR